MDRAQVGCPLRLDFARPRVVSATALTVISLCLKVVESSEDELGDQGPERHRRLVTPKQNVLEESVTNE